MGLLTTLLRNSVDETTPSPLRSNRCISCAFTPLLIFCRRMRSTVTASAHSGWYATAAMLRLLCYGCCAMGAMDALTVTASAHRVLQAHQCPGA